MGSWMKSASRLFSNRSKLPNGKPLTVVLLGKTGNGKSSAGNVILGQELFGASDGAQSETVTCTKQKRKEEREITVIDTPGVMDTATVKGMTSKTSKAKYMFGFRDVQQQTLKELARMVLYAPHGFDAILLVAKFGSRFTQEDNDALTMLTKFLGEDAKKYMILLFTHGDDAEHNARKKRIPVDEYLKTWIDGMVEWMKRFIHSDLEDRVALFNCRVMPDEEPEAYKKQLCKVIEMIDKIAEKQKAPFKTEFTDSNLEDVLDSVAPEDKKKVEEEKVIEIKDKIEKKEGGCYPASATFVDVSGRRRKMESLLLGEEVQVITNESITSEPVITFIHRQPDLFQKFMQITTLRYKKILKITEDHLIFVEKNGKESVIPARDVKIGDIVYVKGGQEMPEKDAVQCVSIVFEKGVYAPVTLSGTILVNDVHTSCYFDVLSHVWFHRAMGAARAVYHLSPRMVEWISSIGEEDGFPGWCRLAHKLLLTWNDST